VRAAFWAVFASRGYSSAVGPAPSLQVVCQDSEDNGRLSTLDADGANGQPHRTFQDGKWMFDQGADGGFVSIGPGGARRHRLALRFLAADMADLVGLAHEILVGLQAIGGVCNTSILTSKPRQTAHECPCADRHDAAPSSPLAENPRNQPSPIVAPAGYPRLTIPQDDPQNSKNRLVQTSQPPLQPVSLPSHKLPVPEVSDCTTS
jgi:hypothetical protein